MAPRKPTNDRDPIDWPVLISLGIALACAVWLIGWYAGAALAGGGK